MNFCLVIQCLFQISILLKRTKKTYTWKKETHLPFSSRNIPFLLTRWLLVDSNGSMLEFPTDSIRCLAMEYNHRPPSAYIPDPILLKPLKVELKSDHWL